MAGGKETPRQKMIGMMYLVLTALLALNVSKEIINAFVKLDDKLMDGNKVLITKSESIMSELDNARSAEAMMKIPESQSQVVKWQNVAKNVREMSFAIDKFINLDCKNKLLLDVENKNFVNADAERLRFESVGLMSVENKDDYDAATRLFGGEKGTAGYNSGAEIRNKIHSFRNELLSLITVFEFGGKKYQFHPENVKDSVSLENELDQNVYKEDHDRIRSIYMTLTLPEKLKDHNDEVDWQIGMFDHAPVVAAAALFTSLSNDIRSAEVQALEMISSRVKVPMIPINKIEPLAFARTSYLNVGDTMDISVMIAAYDSTQQTKIRYSINDPEGSRMEINGRIPVKAASPGIYTLDGEIAVKERGVETWKPWSYTYEVGQPAGVVSNEDLAVIYAGFPHTFSASASGYPQEKISLSIPGARVTKKENGKFSVTAGINLVGQMISSVINVQTENRIKTLPGQKFLVKKLPTPEVFFGTLSENVNCVSVSQLRANMAAGIRAGYDQSVPFNPTAVSYRVNSFDMQVNVDGNTIPLHSGSNAFTPQMTRTLNSLRSGMRVTIVNIRATGPSGQVRLGSLSFVIC